MGFLFTTNALGAIAGIVGAIATVFGGAAASGLFEKLAKIIAEHREKSGLLNPPSIINKGIVVTAGNLAVASGAEKAKRIFHPPNPPTYLSHVRPAGHRFAIAKTQVLVRLSEVRLAHARQQRLARWARWAANSLTFGQYVIGGVMATSFIQKQLSSDAIGVFGVLVVAASLVKQHYHPEVNGQVAAQKALLFEALIRQSEDRLVVIEATMEQAADDPALVLELLERISAELTKITTASAIAPAQKRGR